MLTFVPETKDLTTWNGGAVEWRYFTASFVASSRGEPTHVRGTVLAIHKKLPDGTWKVFRAMGLSESIASRVELSGTRQKTEMKLTKWATSWS